MSNWDVDTQTHHPEQDWFFEDGLRLPDDLQPEREIVPASRVGKGVLFVLACLAALAFGWFIVGPPLSAYVHPPRHLATAPAPPVAKPVPNSSPASLLPHHRTPPRPHRPRHTASPPPAELPPTVAAPIPVAPAPVSSNGNAPSVAPPPPPPSSQPASHPPAPTPTPSPASSSPVPEPTTPEPVPSDSPPGWLAPPQPTEVPSPPQPSDDEMTTSEW